MGLHMARIVIFQDMLELGSHNLPQRIFVEQGLRGNTKTSDQVGHISSAAIIQLSIIFHCPPMQAHRGIRISKDHNEDVHLHLRVLMEENNRLRKHIERLERQKCDDIENVFRNKLESVRSSSKSIRKIEKGQATHSKIIPSNHLQNKNYLDSQSSIKQNVRKTINEERAKRMPVVQQQVYVEEIKFPKSFNSNREKEQGTQRNNKDSNGKCIGDLQVIKTKRRAIYQKDNSQKNINRSNQKVYREGNGIERGKPAKKLRNTVYVEQ